MILKESAMKLLTPACTRYGISTNTQTQIVTCLSILVSLLIYMTFAAVLYSAGKPGQYECCVNLLSWSPKGFPRSSEKGGRVG